MISISSLVSQKTLKNSQINNLQDIKNKEIMITQEQYEFASLQSMLISENISLKEIKRIKHSFDVDDLIVFYIKMLFLQIKLDFYNYYPIFFYY